METVTSVREPAWKFPGYRHAPPNHSLPWVALQIPRLLHTIVLARVWLFLAMLTAMLLRPPDLQFYNLDRVALGLTICSLFLRHAILRKPFAVPKLATLPLVGLLSIAIADLVSHSFQQEAWSVLASKWAAPLIVYLLAGLVFDTPAALRKLEVFNLFVLAYLVVVAILFFLGATNMIFPSFIVDDSIGIHADRARGPFLQAVANGLALNLLGLLALDTFRRKRLGSLAAAFLFVALPVAIIATKTRAVWLSFAASVLALIFTSPSRRVRRVCTTLAVLGIIGAISALVLQDRDNSFIDRLQEKSPVEFRLAVYQAGWEMFLMKPIHGWGFDAMQTELTRSVSEFHQKEFFLHNTYLEIAVQHGLIGLSLYIWLIIDLFRIGVSRPAKTLPPQGSFMDAQFRKLWPILLVAYLLNACFVVMNYQYVNALVFTIAGILASQNRAPAPIAAAG